MNMLDATNLIKPALLNVNEVVHHLEVAHLDQVQVLVDKLVDCLPSTDLTQLPCLHNTGPCVPPDAVTSCHKLMLSAPRTVYVV